MAKDEKAKDSNRLFKIKLVARLEVACRLPSLSSRMSNQGNFLPRRCCWVDCPLVGRVYSRVASPPSSAFLRIRGNSLAPISPAPSFPWRLPGKAHRIYSWVSWTSSSRAGTPPLFHGTHRPFCLTLLAILGPFLFPFLRISLHISMANFNVLVRFEYSSVKTDGQKS